MPLQSSSKQVNKLNNNNKNKYNHSISSDLNKTTVKKRAPINNNSYPSTSVRQNKPIRLNHNYIPRTTYAGKIMNWRCYHRLNTIYDFLRYLEVEYPSICTVQVIGKSVCGLDIKLLKISNTNENNSAVWLDATIHSREWISTSVVTFIANLIAKNFDRLPSYITNKDWYLVPVLNPDGYNYTQYIRLWRKNRAKYKKEVVGVDLNRNFSYKWGVNEDEGSSSIDPRNSQYRGPKPFSEPESAAVRNFITGSEKPFQIFLTFHSPEQAITIPWCYTTETCPDYVKLMRGGAAMAKAIYKTTGRIYKVGTFRDTIYCAAGTSLDWSYGIAKIPFSYLIELRKGGRRFILPERQIFDTCKEATVAVKSLMKFVDDSQKIELGLYRTLGIKRPCLGKSELELNQPSQLNKPCSGKTALDLNRSRELTKPCSDYSEIDLNRNIELNKFSACTNIQNSPKSSTHL